MPISCRLRSSEGSSLPFILLYGWAFAAFSAEVEKRAFGAAILNVSAGEVLIGVLKVRGRRVKGC